MIDARGLSCPLPVVMVQKEIKSNHPDVVEVWLDNECSVENVKRFAGNNGYSVASDGGEDEVILTLRKKG